MPPPTPPTRVETADGIATVWLGFPGDPANALSPARLAALDRAAAPLLDCPHLDAVVFRSALPGGFCGGFEPGLIAGLESDADAAAFAAAGQRVTNRIAAAAVPTVAFIEGPCLGPGLELALACDLRLAVAGPDSAFGFPEAAFGVPACWGGRSRFRGPPAVLAGRATLSGREAHRAGLVHDAFSQRRAKVELRTWLDRIQAGARVKRPGGDMAASLAAERAAFRHALRSADVRADVREMIDAVRPPAPAAGVPAFPEQVAFVTDAPELADLPVEVALRGGRVAVLTSAARMTDAVERRFQTAVADGRVTPLEAKQARDRVRVSADLGALRTAGLVIWDERAPFERTEVETHTRPGAVLGRVGPPPGWGDRPRTVGVTFNGVGPPHRSIARITRGPRTSPDAVAALAAWLPRIGVRAQLPVAEAAPVAVLAAA